MAALPYNAHLDTLRTFQVPADQWSEADPLARIRRESFCLEDRVNRLERNLPPEALPKMPAQVSFRQLLLASSPPPLPPTNLLPSHLPMAGPCLSPRPRRLSTC